MRRLFAQLRNFFHRQRAEEQMMREISAHLALLEDEFLRQGMNLPDARLAARQAYGGVEQSKELHRDARSLVWLEQMLQDIRHAFRSLRKSPGFVTVALLSLACGIGVNTAIFTLVNGILLKTLPVSDPDRIVQLTAHIDKENFHGNGFNFLGYRALRRQTSIFADVIAFSGGGRSLLETGGEPARVRLEMVTGSYFPFLNARPELGRLLDEEDDRLEGAHRVCVLSDRAWRMYLGADPGVLNRTLRIDGVPLQVVGVAAAGVIGAELQERPDVWVSTALNADFIGYSRNEANYIWLRVMARLRPGLSFAEARDRLAATSGSIEAALPKNRANAGVVYRIQDASHGFDEWRKELRDPLWILMGAVSLVLLVACANLANLLLARTNERHQEFAIKLSLGISRWRLLRHLLMETFLLVFAGGVLAGLFSTALTRFLLTLFNAGQRYSTLAIAPDASVALYTLGACFVTAVVAGLYPAWQASRTDASPGLKGEALHGSRRSLVRRSLIVVQVALAVVLLFGASLFTHSLRKLKTVDLGYDVDHLLTAEIGKRKAPKNGPAPAQSNLAEALSAIQQLPQVESAAISNLGVLSGMKMSDDITVRETARKAEASFLSVGPGYFRTMRIPVFGGRDFQASDRKGSPRVAVINQRLASLLSPDRNPVGQHIDGWGQKSIEIIGVTGNSKYADVREDTKPIVYLAFDQEAQEQGWGVLQIRSRTSLAATERAVLESIQTAAPGWQVYRSSAMELVRDNTIAQDRLLAFLSSLFGTLGTMLSLVGIYGLISYSVTRRTREIGIRMSIGAQSRDVLWLFLRESTLLVAGGMLIGLPLALALARLLRTMLFGVTASEPLDISVTLVLLVLGGLLASIIPSRRATRVNPVQALRYD